MEMDDTSDDQVGGRLIQEGSYGCAFTPPLPCKKGKKDKKRKDMVGKVIRKKDAEIELSISTLIEGIPGYKRYFLVETEDNCTEKNFKNLREEYASVCKLYAKRSDANLIQLLSSFGGRSLEKTEIGASFDYVAIFHHVLEGLALLHKQGICHCDIHEGNVLIDPKGTPRLIDFGASFVGHTASESTVDNHNYPFSPTFDPQAPEMAIHNAIRNKVSLRLAIYQTIHEKAVLQKASTVLGLSLEKQERDLDTFWKKQDMTWTGDSWVPFYKTYWRTWDAFSVGVMFFKVLLKCLHVPKFINTVWLQHANTISTVLKGLLQANPNYRMSVEEALARMERII